MTLPFAMYRSDMAKAVSSGGWVDVMWPFCACQVSSVSHLGHLISGFTCKRSMEHRVQVGHVDISEYQMQTISTLRSVLGSDSNPDENIRNAPPFTILDRKRKQLKFHHLL